MKAQLLISLDDNGAIGVEGPIGQKMLCYGLLDCARDAIKDYNDKQVAMQPKITPPTNGEMLSISRLK